MRILGINPTALKYWIKRGKIIWKPHPEPYRFQNLISLCNSHSQTSLKVSSESIPWFLRYLAHRQTNKQTRLRTISLALAKADVITITTALCEVGYNMRYSLFASIKKEVGDCRNVILVILKRSTTSCFYLIETYLINIPCCKEHHDKLLLTVTIYYPLVQHPFNLAIHTSILNCCRT